MERRLVQFQLLNNKIAHNCVGMVTGFVSKAYSSDENELQGRLEQGVQTDKKGPMLGTVEME